MGMIIPPHHPDNLVALVPLEQLQPLPKNVRRSHRVHALAKSIQTHGFGQAVTVNRRTGHTIAGNGRLKALAHLKRASQKPPAGVAVSAKNEWLVPVLYGYWKAEDEPTVALALNGGLNHSLEGDWDAATIAELIDLAKPMDLEALNVPAQTAEQFALDFVTPIEEPVINLDGIERVSVPDALCTVRLQVSEQLAARARKLAKRGVTAVEILTHGIDKLDPPEDSDAPAHRQRGRKATAQVEQPAARKQNRASPKRDPANARGRKR